MLGSIPGYSPVGISLLSAISHGTASASKPLLSPVLWSAWVLLMVLQKTLQWSTELTWAFQKTYRTTQLEVAQLFACQTDQ